jgi:hypothetical protein
VLRGHFCRGGTWGPLLILASGTLKSTTENVSSKKLQKTPTYMHLNQGRKSLRGKKPQNTMKPKDFLQARDCVLWVEMRIELLRLAFSLCPAEYTLLGAMWEISQGNPGHTHLQRVSTTNGFIFFFYLKTCFDHQILAVTNLYSCFFFSFVFFFGCVFLFVFLSFF